MKCVICLEKKSKSIYKCSTCNEGIICINCINFNYNKFGIFFDECPTCRTKTNNFKIYPKYLKEKTVISYFLRLLNTISMSLIIFHFENYSILNILLTFIPKYLLLRFINYIIVDIINKCNKNYQIKYKKLLENQIIYAFIFNYQYHQIINYLNIIQSSETNIVNKSIILARDIIIFSTILTNYHLSFDTNNININSDSTIRSRRY